MIRKYGAVVLLGFICVISAVFLCVAGIILLQRSTAHDNLQLLDYLSIAIVILYASGVSLIIVGTIKSIKSHKHRSIDLLSLIHHKKNDKTCIYVDEGNRLKLIDPFSGAMLEADPHF